MRGLLTAFLAELGLVAWRDLHQEKVAPPPSDFVAVVIIWTFLGVVSESERFAPAAAALGWMVVLSTAIQVWTPKSPLSISKPGPTTPTSSTQAAASAPVTIGGKAV